MIQFAQTQRLPFGAITVHRAATALFTAVERVEAWRKSRQTAQILRQLSPRQLEDIGLSRDDIDRLSF